MKVDPPILNDHRIKRFATTATTTTTTTTTTTSTTPTTTAATTTTPNVYCKLHDRKLTPHVAATDLQLTSTKDRIDAWRFTPEEEEEEEYSCSTGRYQYKMADRSPMPRLTIEAFPDSTNKEPRSDRRVEEKMEEDEKVNTIPDHPTDVQQQQQLMMDQDGERTSRKPSSTNNNNNNNNNNNSNRSYPEPSACLMSSSLPNGDHLLTLPGHPRAPAVSLPPSPLLPPSEPPSAASASLSSLLERRRNKQRNVNPPLLLFHKSEAKELQKPPTPASSSLSSSSSSLLLVVSSSSKYDAAEDDEVGSSTPPMSIMAPGQFPVRVLSDLYLGNAQTSADLSCLQRHNIRYIVNVTSDVSNSFEDRSDFQYLRIPIADDSWSQDMEHHFQSAITFIEEGRKNNRSILIHCMAGVSRSVTVTVAYLMKSENLTMDDAYDHLRRCKSNINPNLSLMGQLQLFGQKLQNERRKLQSKTTTTTTTTTTQQNLTDFSSLSIDGTTTTLIGGRQAEEEARAAYSLDCLLITPETATSFDREKENYGGGDDDDDHRRIFNFPCSPPPTPSARFDCFELCLDGAKL